jgi:small redox-active disulfide protein 2
MIIQILGSGCANCQTLYKQTEDAVQELKIDATVEKITDFQKIATYGILRTPGLVIDGQVASSGYVPKIEEIKTFILKYSGTKA